MDKIKLENKGTIAEISFNRPEKHNAYDLDTLEQLMEAFQIVKEDKKLRAVILYGAGERAFSSGGDIASVFENLTVKRASILVRMIQDTFSMPEQIPCAVIAAINGYCFGGGFEVALSSDIRIASRSALMGLPEASLGILSGAGGTQRLIRYVGSRSVANEMLMANRKLTAEEAYRLGVVSSLYDTNEELLKAAREMAERVATAVAPTSVEAIKKCVLYGQDMDLNNGLRLEGELWASLFGTADQKEGVVAFQQKRKPQFPGRAEN